MADERDDQEFSGTEDRQDGQQPTGQQGQQAPLGQQPGQPAMGSQSGQTDQPIGGNDSGTGTGTPLSQGADFGGQGASGQAQPSGGTDTMTGQSDPSKNDAASKSDGGFIGSQGGGSDDYLQKDKPSGDATGGSDFAERGQGALDENAKEPRDDGQDGSKPSY